MDGLFLEADDGRVADAGEDLDVEEFCDARLEFEEGYRFACGDVDDPDAAFQIVQMFDNWQASKCGGFADFGEADKSEAVKLPVSVTVWLTTARSSIVVLEVTETISGGVFSTVSEVDAE